MVPMIGANIGILILIVIGQFGLAKAFGRSTINKKIPLYGSRYSPMEGERVVTAPTMGIAIEDRPVQGSVPTA
jgi:hypothetical protein